ncbi:MAG: zinc-ribbon domain-containing protein [Dehalococcoidales bacterium]
MTVFIAILLTVLTFAFIIYPFFRQRLPSADSTEDEKLHQLLSRRDTTYAMLKELEFDFQSGILTEEDYRELESKYKKEGISILKDIDDSKKGADVEEEIERRVLELRRREGQFCPQCATRYEKGDRFCSHCGTNLRQREQID